MIRTALVLILLIALPAADDEKFTVAGKITGHKGKPVEGATVKAFERQSWRLVRWWEADKVMPVAVGKDGKYEFTLERTGWYIIADAPGHADMAHLVEPPIGTSTVRCDIRLPKALTIAGRVVDQNGDPVLGASLTLFRGAPGVSVSAQFPMPRTQFSRRSGTNGRFAFDPLAAGRHELLVAAENKVIERLRGIEAGRRDLKIVLRPGKVIRGRVVDADGDPIQDALVSVNLGGDLQHMCRAGPDGRFTTWLLHPDRTYTLYVARKGALPDPRLGHLGPRVDAKPGGKEITIKLK
jgi:protocatechuate 3,4-dioxygenase beta subunit